jgi:hypothetical protein
MKGFVFLEFFNLVEAAFGAEVAASIRGTARGLPSKGTYAAMGTYDHSEMIRLATALSARSGVAIPDLVRAFGKHLLARFGELFPQYFEGVDSSFAFLQRFQDLAHKEMRANFPDAELPAFDVRALDPSRLELVYRSSRPFAELVEGLLQGCAERFHENLAISREDLGGAPERSIRFVLTRS